MRRATPYEERLLQKLLALDDRDCEAYRAQLQNLHVSEDGLETGLRLYPFATSAAAPPRQNGILADGYYQDDDAKQVQVSLLLKNGALYFLEYTKTPPDVELINKHPDLERLHVVKAQAPTTLN